MLASAEESMTGDGRQRSASSMVLIGRDGVGVLYGVAMFGCIAGVGILCGVSDVGCIVCIVVGDASWQRRPRCW